MLSARRRRARRRPSAGAAGAGSRGCARAGSRSSRCWSRRALRDEGGEAAPEALRPIASDGHAGTAMAVSPVDRSDVPSGSGSDAWTGSMAAAPGRSSRSANLVGQVAIGLRALRGGRVEVDRQAVARRLGQADAPRDDRVVHAIAEVPSHLVADLGARAACAQSYIVSTAPLISSRGLRWSVTRSDRGEELPQALEREVLALDRDQRRVGRRQGVDREQARARADSRSGCSRSGPEPDPAARTRRRSRCSSGVSSTSAPASAIDDGISVRPSTCVETARSSSWTSSMTAS